MEMLTLLSPPVLNGPPHSLFNIYDISHHWYQHISKQCGRASTILWLWKLQIKDIFQTGLWWWTLSQNENRASVMVLLFKFFFLLAGCPSYSWRPNKQLHSVSPPSYKLYDNNNHMSSSALVLKPIFWQMHRTWPLTLASSICGLFPLVGTFFPFFQYKPTKSSLPQTSLLTLIVGLRLRVFF